VPTIIAGQHIVDHGTAGGIAPHVVRKGEQIGEWHRRSVRMAHEQGVKVAFGTDCGTPFNKPGEYATELRYMTECGFSTSAALDAATRVAADALGLADRIGTLEAGKLADIVIVAGDPLADINNMTDRARIAWVFTGGRAVRTPDGPTDGEP
jgi:imidazolonepropionase-like amidohydrolase